LKVLEVWKVLHTAKTDLKSHWISLDLTGGMIVAARICAILCLFVVLCSREETAQREDHGVDRFTKYNSRGSPVRRTPIWSDTLQMLGRGQVAI